MIGCHLKFEPMNDDTLARSISALKLIIEAKCNNIHLNQSDLEHLFLENELRYFSKLTPDEHKEWVEFWKKTPISLRHSPDLPTPQWDFDSMIQTFMNGEYEIIGIQQDDNEWYLKFSPYSDPYGGTGCMVAFLESFNHRVIGIDDGDGYHPHMRKMNYWKPK